MMKRIFLLTLSFIFVASSSYGMRQRQNTDGPSDAMDISTEPVTPEKTQRNVHFQSPLLTEKSSRYMNNHEELRRRLLFEYEEKMVNRATSLFSASKTWGC